MTTFRAGAASLPLSPPLGLPMIGFVRQAFGALGYGIPLEVGAIALERDDTRVILCGVDIVGIDGAELDLLLERVAAATGATTDGVLLNWSHTHLAPTGGQMNGALFGELDDDGRFAVDAFARVVQDKIVTVAQLAVEALEPAAVVWGKRIADVAVNRRERSPDGSNGGTVLGWNPNLLIDLEVTTLQARRPDESVIATLVSYGAHPVTTGYDMFIYSADFPGPLRRVVRAATGGECVFFQAAAGNVLPRFAFTDDEVEAERMGTRIAIAALESVADRLATPVRLVRLDEGSVTPISKYRREQLESEAPALSAVATKALVPLMPLPTLEELATLREQYELELEAARASGDRGRFKVAYYHAGWARRIEAQVLAGTAPTQVETPVHAVRIGDGVIVTGPGETFTEYGIAVKERSPAATTLYAGYTNGMLGYLPTADEYQYGGYEAGYGYKSFGFPCLFDPSVEEILVSTGVRQAERLFPDVEPWEAGRGWVAKGELPEPPGVPPFRHPSAE